MDGERHVPPALCRGEATPLFPLSAPQWSKGRAIGRIPEPHSTRSLTYTMPSAPLFAPLPTASTSTTTPEPAPSGDDFSLLLDLIESFEYQDSLRLARKQNVASRSTDDLRKFLAEFDAAFGARWGCITINFSYMHEDIVRIVVNICANALAAEDGTLSLDSVGGPLTVKQDRVVRQLWDLLCECLIPDICSCNMLNCSCDDCLSITAT